MRKLTHATLEDLEPWALRAFEQDYATADRRQRCSREDFAAGYLAALVRCHAWSAFREAVEVTTP